MGALIVGLAVGCTEDLLTFIDPDNITDEVLVGEIGRQTIRNGAFRDFVVAHQGVNSTDGQVMLSGLFADEWQHAGTFTTRNETDRRIIAEDNGTLGAVYLRAHQARVSSRSASAFINNPETNPDAATDVRIGETLMFNGFMNLVFAGNYCNGVPFSTATDEGFEFGAPQTNAQIYQAAVDGFNAALAAPIAATEADAARVGMGRALLGLGQFAAAGQAVASVGTTEARTVAHSDDGNLGRNQIFEFNQNVFRWGVPLNGREGGVGIDWEGATDPRVQVVRDPMNRAFDQSFPEINLFMNYTERGQSSLLATGIEARLIQAEAALQAGDNTGFINTLNTLRASYSSLAAIIGGDPAGSLAPLSDPGTAAGRVDLLFNETAFWVHSQNRRLFDLRRLVRQYGRAVNSVFPNGAYFKASFGGTFGNQVAFPIPIEEDNNPNSIGCLDNNA